MKILAIRHLQSRFNNDETDDLDSDVSNKGIDQIPSLLLKTRDYIRVGFVGYVSPYLRTLQTAKVIQERYKFKIPFIVDNRIGEFDGNLEIPNRQIQFPNFNWSQFDRKVQYNREELKNFSKEFIANSIVVSHMSTIIDLAEILTGLDLKQKSVPNGSFTLIDDGKLVFIGEK